MCEIETLEKIRIELEKSLNLLIKNIGKVKIGTKEQFPFGWRKAGKGRTVWRILEELIVQNLENNPEKYNISKIDAAESEVGVYDLTLTLNNIKNKVYINIKSALLGGRTNKDDLSKAQKLLQFYNENSNRKLFIATFSIKFNDGMTIELAQCNVLPISWIPDIYVNPSNNGNLQSSKYKYITGATLRTNEQFIRELTNEIDVAEEKKRLKRKNN